LGAAAHIMATMSKEFNAHIMNFHYVGK